MAQGSIFRMDVSLARVPRWRRAWRLLAALVAVGALALPTAAADGLYWGIELGASFGGEVESTRTNIGVPTNCDQWLGAATLADGTTLPLPASQCHPRPLPASANTFDLSLGHAIGVNVGRRFGEFRLEADYFHQRRSGERLPLVVPGDPKQQEFVERSEQFDDLGGHHLFANVFYDLKRGAEASRFSPFVGVGVGAMRLQGGYKALSIRNSDRSVLAALGRNPNAAGTTSRADEDLSDTLFGYQLIAGFDTALKGGRTVTAKLRWGKAFADFEDGDNPWRPLRDHDSTVAPGGAPIRYGIRAERPGFLTISVGIKFALD